MKTLLVAALAAWPVATLAQPQPLHFPRDFNALCETVANNSACSEIGAGVVDGDRHLAWRLLTGTWAWEDGGSACATAFGNGWHMPRLAELDDGYSRYVFGFCHMSVWAADADGSRAWHREVDYEGPSRLSYDQQGRQVAVGGCGPYRESRELLDKGEKHQILCVKDLGDDTGS